MHGKGQREYDVTANKLKNMNKTSAMKGKAVSKSCPSTKH